jgi:hypothetical protein
VSLIRFDAHVRGRAKDVRVDGLLGDCAHGSQPAADFARLDAAWQAAEKIVYSRTLAEPRTR